MTSAATSRLERRLWVAVFAPSLAWITALILSFVLSHEICVTGRRWILYLITGSAMAAAAAGAVAGWRTWRRLTGEKPPSELVGARRIFMAAGGFVLALYFALAILALAIPQIVHRPCD